MKLLVALAVVLSGSVLAADSPIRIAVQGFQGLNVKPEALTFYSEHLATSLRMPGLSVVTSREIQTLLGFERQKTLLGCNESSSECIAELASALGVDAIVVGDVGRFGDTIQVTVKALGSKDAKVLELRSTRVQGEVALLDAIAAMAPDLTRAIFESKGRALPAALTQKAAPVMLPSASIRPYALIPLGFGVALGVSGGVLVGLAGDDHAALSSATGEPLTELQANELRAGGATKQTVGAVLLTAGAVSLVVAGAIALFGGPSDAPVVSVVPVQSGAVFSLSGRLP